MSGIGRANTIRNEEVGSERAEGADRKESTNGGIRKIAKCQ